jgi:thiol:disulfide interchange protein DsbC
MKFSTLLLAAAALMASLLTWAAPVNQALEEQLRATLENPKLGLTVETVSASAIPGLFEVQFANGPLVYATEKGDFFIVGDLYSNGPDGFVNLAETRRDTQRLAQMEQLSEDDMIIFAPEGETRATVTVFTDVSCFYCQKLHQEVPELNKRGVAVRYLAFPRAGVGSPAYRQLATAWCADDKQASITALKNRETVPDNVCPGNPVAEQYVLGQQMGVNGTPAIITETGSMIPGYKAADDLIATLGLK